jgi:poly(3-hydroxyalkanoate) synthetase
MVDPDAFTPKDNVATAGSVVDARPADPARRADDKVFAAPLLMVPLVINKFYIMDISPGRSMIEYFLRQGIQVFAISWRIQ